MGSKLFLDATILLDITLQRRGFDKASAILNAGINGMVHLFTSPAVLHVASYYTRKHYTEARSRLIFSALLNDVTIIDCNHDTALLAIHSSMPDLEDALQYYTALAHRLDYFISSDKELKKAAFPILPVYTSDEWSSLFES